MCHYHNLFYVTLFLPTELLKSKAQIEDYVNTSHTWPASFGLFPNLHHAKVRLLPKAKGFCLQINISVVFSRYVAIYHYVLPSL